MIKIRDFTFRYREGDRPVVSGIDLDIPDGAFVGITGAAGSGKSTLTYALNGIIPHCYPGDFYGSVVVDGLDTCEVALTDVSRLVGSVCQDVDSQFVTSVVEDEILYGLENFGVPRGQIEDRVAQALAGMGISEVRDRVISSLSGGQKQRVAIAGVLVLEPEALLLDEPPAGLHPQGVSDLLELLTSLRDSQGMTILMATHDMDVVPLCCDYAYLLGGGSVLAQGTPEELFTKAELLRANHLRLPRIAHLMAILRDRDGLDVTPVGTIGAARRELLRLLKQEELL